MNLEFEKAFTYMFDDPDWLSKLGVLVLLQLVPIFGQILAVGYAVAIVRNVAAGEARPLPAWDRFADMLIDGLKLFVIHLVYAIPLFLLCGIPFSGAIAAAIASDQNRDLGRMFGALTGAGFFAAICLGLLYGLLIQVISPAVTILFSRTSSMGAGFNPGAILGYIRQNTNAYVVTLAVILVVGILVSTVIGFINAVPFVGCLTFIIFPVIFTYVNALNGHLLGQLSRATA